MSARTATGTTGRALRRAKRNALGGLFVAGLTMTSVLAAAQENHSAKPPAEPGLLDSIGQWFDELGSSFKDAGKGVQNFGREAGVAAQTTVEGAKEAAGAVARIQGARMIDGHEKCRTAPNGAPDCLAAATAICKAKGFETGKSADMTTAETCSPQVYLAGRSSGPGCKTETFVSRALCQ